MKDAQDTVQLIDVDKVIASKNPKLLKRLPKFLLRFIKNVIHQDDINHVLSKNHDLFGVDFANGILKDFNITIKVIGESNIPKTGKHIFAANHPLGGLESMVMISVIGRHQPSIKFIVNDILMNLKNLKSIFIGVNKHGSHTKSHANTIDSTYASDSQVLIFPAGLVSRNIKGVITDLEWKKSFITKAIHHQRDIVPIFIDGENSNLFYNMARIRKFFGIKANIEMFLLPKEMFKQRNKTLTLKIGKPIPVETFDKTHPHKYWAGKIKEHVYKMERSEHPENLKFEA